MHGTMPVGLQFHGAEMWALYMALSTLRGPTVITMDNFGVLHAPISGEEMWLEVQGGGLLEIKMGQHMVQAEE